MALTQNVWPPENSWLEPVELLNTTNLWCQTFWSSWLSRRSIARSEPYFCRSPGPFLFTDQTQIGLEAMKSPSISWWVGKGDRSTSWQKSPFFISSRWFKACQSLLISMGFVGMPHPTSSKPLTRLGIFGIFSGCFVHRAYSIQQIATLFIWKFMMVHDKSSYQSTKTRSI